MTRACDAARVATAKTPVARAVAPLQGALSLAPQAILFDLDGTLVDSVPDLARCVNAALASVGHAAADQDRVRGWVGNGAARLLHRALTGCLEGVAPVALHSQAMAVFNAHYAAQPCRDSRLYPGVATTLAPGRREFACIQRCQCPGRRRMGARLHELLRRHHRRRHQRDPTQHPRRAGAGTGQIEIANRNR